MLTELKRAVYEANMTLPARGLVTFTWGNVSGVDRDKGLFVIKPSGVPYEQLTPELMVVMDFDGNKVEGALNPSSDTPTHQVLYNRFQDIGGVTHTHSRWATVFCQMGRAIVPYGTTHADYFSQEVPVTEVLSKEAVEGAYEYNTGVLIADYFEKNHINPVHVPAVLVKSHGPFAFGKNAGESAYHAAVLEEVAMMAYHTELLCPQTPRMAQYILDKHFLRKHGPNAYYGQKANG